MTSRPTASDSHDLIPTVPSEDTCRRRADKDRRRSRHFIRGPIPMPWLEAASSLPGKTLAVGLLLWFMAGMRPGHPVRLSHSLLARFHVGRKAAYRALNALVKAGLVQ